MPYSTCVRCGRATGFPCPLHAKSDADVLGVRPALLQPNVTLLTNARAVRLETDPTGRTVTGVVVEGEGGTETLTGDIVVVSCGAANTAKLLLASASEAHPDGLANGSGEVGRNYMFHNSQAVLALSREPNPTVFQKTLGLNDFYLTGGGHGDGGYPLGNIQMVGKSQAEMYKGEKPIETKLAPSFALDEVAEHAVDFWLSTEDLPRPDNRVTLAADGNVRLVYKPTNQVPAEELYHKLRSMLGHLGMHPTTSSPGTPTSRPASRWPGWPTRPAPRGSAATPPPRSWTSTAAPTRWTTCTWSTPASSPASAR